MSFFAAFIAFFFSFLELGPAFTFFLKVSFLFSERHIGFLIYLVGMPLLFSMLKIIILILASLFLRFFAEIVVETSDYLD
jgi:hypothetical protein